MEEARAEVEAQAPEKRREDLNGRGGTSVRSPSAHEGATALSMVDTLNLRPQFDECLSGSCRILR